MAQFVKFVFAAVFLLLTYELGLCTPRSDFYQLSILYITFFASYTYILTKNLQPNEIRFFIFLGLILRALLVGSFPSFSNDDRHFSHQRRSLPRPKQPSTERFTMSENWWLRQSGVPLSMFPLSDQVYYCLTGWLIFDTPFSLKASMANP